jgi:hypothetical protein
MLATVGDVKSVAKKVWPATVELNIQVIDAPSDECKHGYRVSAFGDRRRLLGRMAAPTLNKLKAQLEQQLDSRSPK